ncbi:MAG: [Fe-S]-binding protein [Cytophagaceae bacterium SCN 52-12]|nr:MAG: [Fe-S]-binding protein [Cytophagaceae bacterium SCN 52-12]
MTSREKVFQAESKAKAADLKHRAIINRVLKQSDDAFRKGKEQFSDLEKARRHAANVKSDTIARLDYYLLEFESNFTKAGGKVIWAENAQQALDAIGEICAGKCASVVVKSKSMVTEEIHLNSFLSERGIDVVETDLGEYIQQLAGEPPYHIVAPSMHKSKEEVARLFHEKLNAPPGLTPEELTLVAREKLRQKFREAEVGITGANFLLADIGGVAITENEGNARLTTSFPRVHIVVTGIEKMLPSVKDLGLFWPLLATHGSGQKIAVYNSVFTGPRKQGEVDGPEEMYVILLDNGRTGILADPVARESLHCIRCGACLNVCPVYKNIGGHTYRATYSGPIGSVITPYLRGMKENKHLSYASSLCGACTEVCPVGINLHGLLLYNRRSAISGHHGSVFEKAAWKGWKMVSSDRRLLDAVGGKTKNFVINRLFSAQWGDHRKLPVFAGKSFSRQWKEKMNQDNAGK